MKKLINFYHLLVEKKYSTLTGGLSFFLLINGGAFLFLLLLVSRLLNINIEIEEMNYVPKDVVIIISFFLKQAKGSIDGSFLIILTSLWGASGLFYHVSKCGEIIYEIPRKKRTKVLSRIVALFAMLIFLILVITAIVFLTLSQYFLSFITIGIVKRITLYLIYIFVSCCFLVFINSYVPPIKIKMRETLSGAVFTSFFWVVSTFVFSLFLNYSSHFGAVYGALAFVLVFLIWLYILTNGLVIGIIINYQKKFCKEKKIS